MGYQEHGDRQGGYRYLFGPVPSRRLGRSLGIDMVPLKTCSFDCRFCEVGRTSEHTLRRAPYVSAAAILAELDAWLRRDGKADAVTLAGSGEPTLNTELGAVLDGVRTRCAIRRVLLTNSTLLHLPEVRADAAKADVVKVSLSAWDQASLEAINRPAPGLRFADIFAGLRAFRAEFQGAMWMEVFVMAGLNDSLDAMERIAELAAVIGPDRVQLNTVSRPPADADAAPASAAVLNRLASVFHPPAELIAGFIPVVEGEGKVTEPGIQALLERRPCTADDIAVAYDVPLTAVAPHLATLLNRGRIREQHIGALTYYLAG